MFSIECLSKHATKVASDQENLSVAITINVVQMRNALLIATLWNHVSVQQDSSTPITAVWILMSVHLEHMNVENQSVLTFQDHIDAQPLSMLFGR